MNSSILTSSAADNGLTPLRWLAFTQAAGNNFTPLAASFTPNTVTAVAQEGGAYPGFAYQFGVAGTLPAWVQPGVGVNVQASVTVSGSSLNLSSCFIVKSVDPNGSYFVVNAPSPFGARDAVAITTALSQTNLDNGAGQVPAPTVSLIMQAQKVMFGATGGAVTVAPVVDAAGNAPDAETVAPGGGQYEVTAPPGFKFDLADWSVKSTAGGTLYARFI